MGKGSKPNCKSTSHRQFKDRAKNRVDDLQGIFVDLQFARKESRNVDVAVLEEQVHQMLREWKSELNEPSPASSLQQGASLGSFSTDICRLLQLCEEEDDATSTLAVPKPEPNDQTLHDVDSAMFPQSYGLTHGQQEQCYPFVSQCKDSPSATRGVVVSSLEDGNQNVATYLPGICPPPSAFLGPKCALWDCARPAQGGLDFWQMCCSRFHHDLALNEGLPGTGPVLRPGGIGLKDGLLFAALGSKAEGKEVGIPECEGAATAKSPWNAPELFNLSVLDGETIREWLFFDKPRRAFESGNRKQRSLPDYSGRGWHESRKQVMNEFSGLKRSYYMDPQPLNNFEWHLYEYEINKCDACALYRLELKAVDGKKSAKGKLNSNDSVAHLQKQMGRLTAEFPTDNKRPAKGRPKVGVGNGYPTVANRVVPTTEAFEYALGPQYNYLGDNIDDYFVT
ncbi:Transcription factor VOZ1 [Linum grandiflorum]